MKTVLALIIVLFCCGRATAQTKTEEPPPSPSQIRQAYRDIQAAPHFSLGGAGFTGGVSDAEKAVRVLVRAKDARLLEALTRDRNPAARLYGLIGMRDMAYPEYKRFAARLEQSEDTVLVLKGCLMSPEKMSALARQFSMGQVTVPTNTVKRRPANKVTRL